jgi:serine/threonine-protein kinase
MSPEQALGKLLDGRSDIFSLGSILYELITGEKAFPGQNTTTVMYKIVHETPTPIRALQPGLDPAVEALILRALAKAPEQRFQSCEELARALDLYINNAVAAMPKTSLGGGLPAPFAAPVVAPPMATPPASISAAGLSGPVASGPATPIAVPAAVAAPGPGTTAQTAPARGGLQFAWLGAGVLGTLLLVILILLLTQMRRTERVTTPTTVPPVTSEARTSQPVATPPPSAEAKTSQPASPALSPETTSSSTSAPEVSLTVAKPAPAVKPPATAETTRPAAAKRTPHFMQELLKIQRGETPVPSRPVPQAPVTSVETKQPAVPIPAQPRVAPPATETTTRSRTSSTSSPLSPGPETLGSLLLKGDLAFQQSRYQEALNAYSKAYQLNPRSTEARRKLAIVLTLLGRPEEARKYQ